MLSLWFPFIKDTAQQGLSSTSVTAIGSGATLNDYGKLGKCYYFDGTTNGYMTTNFPTNIGTSDFSIAVWCKIPTITSGTYFTICTSKTHTSAGVGFGIYWNYSQKKFLWSTADGSAGTEIWMANTVDTLVYDKWIHLVMVRNSSDSKVGYFYINGERYELASVPAIRNIATATNLNIGKTTDGYYPCKMYMNDLRVYMNHALSPKEIKLLSQGLVAHYKLDDNVQQMNNCFNYPTFDTSAAAGGWYHWGHSGHLGTYGQNTNKNYIFNVTNNYSHWVANGDGATADYLCYQSPAFDGGYRSLCCIIKESNSLPITENIAYPAWNSNVSGGVPAHKWTSIISIGNGFYLCKVEGFQQTEDNDLVGIYVKPGYTIYITCAYLENNRTVCSDIFYNTDIVYDCSGYNYNGINYGSVISNSAPRYLLSTEFDGSTAYIEFTNLAFMPNILPNEWSFAFWVYNQDVGSRSVIFSNYNLGGVGGSSFGFEKTTGELLRVAYVNGTFDKTIPDSTMTSNTWVHFCITKTSEHLISVYRNGELIYTYTNANCASSGVIYRLGRDSRSDNTMFKGKLSDFRVYATAISAEDILELYHTSASIDKNGNLYAYELKEE